MILISVLEKMIVLVLIYDLDEQISCILNFVLAYLLDKLKI